MIKILWGSILDMEVDAIVNPVNEELVTGGGVDRLISKTVGEPMELAKRSIGRCPVGEAVYTSGFNLKARYIVHTTSPRFYTLSPYEVPREELLASCYTKSLELARSLGATSIAFPALGTGAYNWPHEESAQIALSAIEKWIVTSKHEMQVYIVLIREETAAKYVLNKN